MPVDSDHQTDKITITTIRVLDHVDLFVGIDGRNHGPFERGEVVSLLRIHARNLVEINKKANYVEPIKSEPDLSIPFPGIFGKSGKTSKENTSEDSDPMPIPSGVSDGIGGERKESGLGPNPLKYALPLTVRFLKPCDQFVGEDLQKLGEVTNYGLYQVDDVAALPKLNATNLIMKGVAVEAITKKVPGGKDPTGQVAPEHIHEEPLPVTCVDVAEVRCRTEVRSVQVGPDLFVPGKMAPYGPFKPGAVKIVPLGWAQNFIEVGYFEVLRSRRVDEEAKA